MFSFLEQRRVKALLVACNTISCVIDRCADAVSCPTFNAVQAGADAVSRLDVDRVGVISTVFTHNSRCYPQRILPKAPKSWWCSAAAAPTWPGWWIAGRLPARPHCGALPIRRILSSIFDF